MSVEMRNHKSYKIDLVAEKPIVQGEPSVSFDVCGKVLNAKVICVEEKPNGATILIEVDNGDREALKELTTIAKAHLRPGTTNEVTFVMPNCEAHPNRDTVIRVNVDRIKQWALTLTDEICSHFNLIFTEENENKEVEDPDLEVPDYS